MKHLIFTWQSTWRHHRRHKWRAAHSGGYIAPNQDLGGERWKKECRKGPIISPGLPAMKAWRRQWVASSNYWMILKVRHHAVAEPLQVARARRSSFHLEICISSFAKTCTVHHSNYRISWFYHSAQLHHWENNLSRMSPREFLRSNFQKIGYSQFVRNSVHGSYIWPWISWKIANLRFPASMKRRRYTCFPLGLPASEFVGSEAEINSLVPIISQLTPIVMRRPIYVHSVTASRDATYDSTITVNADCDIPRCHKDVSMISH
jgi:hypothetical protein